MGDVPDGLSRSDTLNSWKEIANYLDRGVRTVQRWERDLQLPVRRPRGTKRSAVLAVRSEIDAWLRTCPQLTKADRNGNAGRVRRKYASGSRTAGRQDLSEPLRTA
jgi:hypothetical protein